MAPLGNDPAGLFKAAQVIAGEFTAPRPMFRQFYDSFVGRLRRPELPTSHLQAIVLASRRLEQKDIPVPDPREDKAAFALGLFALGSTDALSNFAMAAISEGLCDPPGRADATKQRKARAGAALILRRTMGYAEERAGRRANRGMMPPPSVAAVQPQRAMLEAIIDPAASWASPQAL
ncbi:MAG: hypothetical protein KDJ16_18335, partial [Hyphomicrobiales bacterium]|nr:hypothetical protein [Hyphomicrobiales bacterium]